MPETVDPKTTAYRAVPERSAVPVGRHDSESVEAVPAARRRSRGTSTRTARRCVRGSAGIYYARQNMLSQVGSVTTNGIQQKSDFRDAFTAFARHAGVAEPAARRAPCRRARSRSSPASASSIATTRTRASTASTSASSASWRRASAAYVDFTVRQGRAPDAVPELQRARHRRRGRPAADARHDDLHRRQSVRAAAGRRVRDQQPRPRRSIAARRSACASASRSNTSSRPTTCCRRTKTTTRTSAIRSPIARSTSTT